MMLFSPSKVHQNNVICCILHNLALRSHLTDGKQIVFSTDVLVMLALLPDLLKSFRELDVKTTQTAWINKQRDSILENLLLSLTFCPSFVSLPLLHLQLPSSYCFTLKNNVCVREKQQANAIKHIADKILIELLDSAQEHTKNLIRAQRSEGRRRERVGGHGEMY